MGHTNRKLPGREQGALIILTLLILIVVSMLGMSAIDSTGLEMKMSSNSRLQQEAFEAAEYTLSWVENDIVNAGYFSVNSITNQTGCGTICFSNACTNGYCFYGIAANDPAGCQSVLATATLEPYEDTSVWTTTTKHKLPPFFPNAEITTKYIIEFFCYATRDADLPIVPNNSTPMYRITVFAAGDGGKARAMLRSVIKQI